MYHYSLYSPVCHQTKYPGVSFWVLLDFLPVIMQCMHQNMSSMHMGEIPCPAQIILPL